MQLETQELVNKAGLAVNSIQDIAPGDIMDTRFVDGHAFSIVLSVSGEN